MIDLIKQFSGVREDFLKTLEKFPTDKVDDKLFGDWNLIDVIAHFSG